MGVVCVCSTRFSRLEQRNVKHKPCSPLSLCIRWGGERRAPSLLPKRLSTRPELPDLTSYTPREWKKKGQNTHWDWCQHNSICITPATRTHSLSHSAFLAIFEVRFCLFDHSSCNRDHNLYDPYTHTTHYKCPLTRGASKSLPRSRWPKSNKVFYWCFPDPSWLIRSAGVIMNYIKSTLLSRHSEGLDKLKEDKKARLTLAGNGRSWLMDDTKQMIVSFVFFFFFRGKWAKCK